MKPARFAYVRPRTIEEAIDALTADEARPLAGGQSLVPMLNLRLARPRVLVDLADIQDRSVRVDGDTVTIGGGITHADLGRHPLVTAHLPLVAACVPHIGHEPIRRRGTLGGSLAHAEPTAELVLVALAADASVVVAGPSGRRNERVDDFVIGPFTTTLDTGDLVVGVEFPSHRTAAVGFAELARRRGDFAIVAVACVISAAPHGWPAASLAVAGVGPRPQRLTGIPIGDPRPAALPEVVAAAVDLVEFDVIASELAYKRAVVPAVIEDALAATGWFST